MIVAGVGRKSSFEQLASLGLIDRSDLGDLKEGAEGRGLKEGRTIKGWKIAQSDPNAWVRDYLLPAFSSHGVTDNTDMMKAISSIFQNQIAGQMVNILAQQQSRIDKDQRIVEGALGVDAWRKFSTDPLISSEALGHALASRIATQVPAEGMGSAFDWLARWLAPGPDDDPTPFEQQRAITKSMQWQSNADLAARFPGAAGSGVNAEDAVRISKHRIAESYRWQQSLIADPEAHRGAAMMNLDQHQAAPPPPQDVHVTGDAKVQATVTVVPGSELISIVQRIGVLEAQMSLVPTQGQHSGRMDSDAIAIPRGALGRR
jgi:hypothetical protein